MKKERSNITRPKSDGKTLVHASAEIQTKAKYPLTIHLITELCNYSHFQKHYRPFHQRNANEIPTNPYAARDSGHKEGDTVKGISPVTWISRIHDSLSRAKAINELVSDLSEFRCISKLYFKAVFQSCWLRLVSQRKAREELVIIIRAALG